MINSFKVKISLHPLFLVIVMLSIFTGYFIEIMLLFLFVLVHEYGHYFMAKHFSWKINEMKILPFGGVLVVDDTHVTNAKEETLVAIAGPLQNIFLIVLIWLCGQFHWLSYEWVDYMIKANLWLIIFNLLPITPLDGGKIIQAQMSILLPYFQAIKLMCWTSIVASSIMILFAMTYGVWSSGSGPQLNLLLVGAFLLADNIMRLKHLPYLLYRFILHRSKMLEKISEKQISTEAVPLFIQDHDTLLTLFKKIKRESNHLFYYRSTRTKKMELTSEHNLLEKFNSSSHLNRALIDIFD